MNRLVSYSYSETSSDDEDRSRGVLPQPVPVESSSLKFEDHTNSNNSDNHSWLGNGAGHLSNTLDLGDPITDESETDQHNVDLDQDNVNLSVGSDVISHGMNVKSKSHSPSPLSLKYSSSDESKSEDRSGVLVTQILCREDKNTALPRNLDVQFQSQSSGMKIAGLDSDTAESKFSVTSSTRCKSSPMTVNTESAILSSCDKNMNSTEYVPRSTPKLQTESQNVVHSLGQLRKRKLSNDSTDKEKRLCIPDSIQTMYSDPRNRWVDNPAQHDNRIRSFPHLEGNWATHVFVPVKRDERLVRFVEDLLRFLRPPSFQVLPEFHVSLSRTVTVRHHWIEPLVDSLRENLKHLKSCISDLTAVRLFTNDEKTRTFVCLELSQDDSEFLDYVKAIDKSFAEFRLPPYYENPSFHISIGWCLGDATETISEERLFKAREMLGDFMAANPDLSIVFVQQICCQSGNKSFVLTLEET